MSRELQHSSVDDFQPPSRARQHSIARTTVATTPLLSPVFFFFSLSVSLSYRLWRMHTPGRCRWDTLHESACDHDRISSAVGLADPTRAMAWSTIDVISLLRVVHIAEVWPAAQAMGVSLPRSRASFSQFSSFLRSSLDFFSVDFEPAKLFL